MNMVIRIIIIHYFYAYCNFFLKKAWNRLTKFSPKF